MKRTRKTPAKRQAELFVVSAVGSKAGEIPPDCRLPSTVEAIENGRMPTLKQLELLPDDSAMARLRAIKRNETQTHN